MTTLLAVTAHPDDECFLFGGALALHARRGGRAGLLCLTDGQVGRAGGLVPQEALGPFRHEELKRAVDVLGIPHLFTPGLIDGELQETGDGEGAALVAEVAADFGADVLLTFGPDGASGHGDHKACWRWTRAAAGERRLYAATFPPGMKDMPRGAEPLPVTTLLDVSELGDPKSRAFAEHRTQQDHLERHQWFMEQAQGREWYHRVQPVWNNGDPLETSLTDA